MQKISNNLISSDMKSNSGFSPSVATVLRGLDAGQYVPIFRKYDLGRRDIEELSNEDLLIMGIDSPLLRNNILSSFKKKSLDMTELKRLESYELCDALQIITNANKQLHNVKIAIIINNISLKNDHFPNDVLLLPNTYATAVILEVIQNIDEKLDAISDVLTYNLPKSNIRSLKKNKRKKKVIIGTVGGALVVFLTLYLVKSLKTL